MLCIYYISYIYKIPESSLRANCTDRFPPQSLEMQLSLTFLHLEFFKICPYSESCQSNSRMAGKADPVHTSKAHGVVEV
jgi:hypothetical protein